MESAKPRGVGRLHPVALVLGVLALAASLWAGRAIRGDGDLLWVSYALGSFVGAMVIAAALATAAFFLARRSRRVFTITLSSVLALAALSNGTRAIRAQRTAGAARAQQDASLDVQNFRAELDQALKPEPVHAGSKSADSSGQDDVDARLKALATKQGGDRAIIITASAEVIKATTQQAAKVRAAMEHFNTIGGLGAASLTSTRDIQDRLAALEALAKENAALAECTRSMPEAYRSALEKGGFNTQKAALHSREFAVGANIPRQLSIIKYRSDSVSACMEYLSILNEQWGRWSVQQDRVILEDEASGKALEAALDRVVAADTALEEHLRAMSGSGTPPPERGK